MILNLKARDTEEWAKKKHWPPRAYAPPPFSGSSAIIMNFGKLFLGVLTSEVYYIF